MCLDFVEDVYSKLPRAKNRKVPIGKFPMRKFSVGKFPIGLWLVLFFYGGGGTGRSIFYGRETKMSGGEGV